MHELIPPAFNFTLLVIGLVYLLRKPVQQMVAARQTEIRTQVEEARTQREEAQRRFREFSDRLATLEAETSQTLENARRDGETMREKIIKDAYAAADRIVRDTESTVQTSIQDYKDQIRRETIARAVEMAERIIRERLSSDDQRRIVNEYMGKVQ